MSNQSHRSGFAHLFSARCSFFLQPEKPPPAPWRYRRRLPACSTLHVPDRPKSDRRQIPLNWQPLPAWPAIHNVKLSWRSPQIFIFMPGVLLASDVANIAIGTQLCGLVLGEFGHLRELTKCQQTDGTIINDAQILLAQGQGIRWFIAVGKDHEQHILIPDFLKTRTSKTDIAECRVRDKHMVVVNITHHHKVFEAGIFDRHDSRVLKRVEISKGRAKTATFVAQRSDKPLHVEQGKAAPLNNLVGLAKLQQAFHYLAFLQIATKEIIQQ